MPKDVVPPEIRARLVRPNAASAQSTGPTIGGIVNAAGYSPTLSEAGTAAIFGTNLGSGVCPAFVTPLPTSLCGTAVTMDGISLPEFYVSPNQINVVLPLGTGDRTLSVITAAGTATKTVTLHDHAPGLYVWPDWVAASQHLNYDVMGPLQPIDTSDPKDNTVVLYLAGAGKVVNRETPLPGTTTPLPTTADQTPYQVQRPTVFVNGTRVVDTDIQFAGMAPGLIGVAQMNLTLHTPGVNEVVACQNDSLSQTTQCSNPATVFVTDGTPYTFGRITSPGAMSDGEHDLSKITGTENGKAFRVGKGGYFLFNETGTINLVLSGNGVYENFADTFTSVAAKVMAQPRYRKFQQIHFGNANLPTQESAHAIDIDQRRADRRRDSGLPTATAYCDAPNAQHDHSELRTDTGHQRDTARHVRPRRARGLRQSDSYVDGCELLLSALERVAILRGAMEFKLPGAAWCSRTGRLSQTVRPSALSSDRRQQRRHS